MNQMNKLNIRYFEMKVVVTRGNNSMECVIVRRLQIEGYGL